MIAALATSILGLKVENYYAKDSAASQDSANDEIDARKPAFNIKVKAALGQADPWTNWEIDRRLTPTEESELRSMPASIESTQRIWDFIRKAGGRRVDGDANGYKFEFTSERHQSVSITEVSATAVKCWTSQAKTYISLEQGGFTGWEDVYFDLDSTRSHIPLLQGTPQDSRAGIRFSKAISLGGNETPAYLKVLPNSTTQSCNWSLEFKYDINSGPDKPQTVSTDEKGNALVFNGPYATDADVWGPGPTGTFTKRAP
ncbi:hypothetical protein ACFWBX_11890 [Streptomyces sp. NPDC059991]|uniref:hypothetical protein n=1 Tax=Streptomyces sp. NPDC059991 TaxID=3347028 RepID=UPI00369DA792